MSIPETIRKLRILVILFFVFTVVLSGRSAVAQTCPHDGDINEDDSLTPADALLAFQEFLTIANPRLNACQLDHANVNRDAAITPADALCIFQAFLSLESCNPDPINHPPVPNLLPAVVGNEDATLQPQDLSAAFTDPDGDELTLEILPDTKPEWLTATLEDKTLSLTLAPDQHGEAEITIRADDGRGGQADNTLSVRVRPVNDPPRFMRGANQVALPGAASQNVPGWAKGVSPGPANEADQQLSFELSNDNEALFVKQPSIAPDGTLTYTPGNDPGEAEVTVRLRDDGGTDDGGIDAGEVQKFTIKVLEVNLVEIGGNNQTAAPGQRLAKPLVVRVEDELGNPIVGVEVAAEITQGDAVFVNSDAMPSTLAQSVTRFAASLDANGSTTAVAVTDENGEAQFFLQAGTGQQNIVTQVTFLDQVVEFTTFVVAEIRECDAEPTNMGIGFGNSVVNCVINPAVDLDQFRFEAVAGDIVRIVVSGRSNAFDPRLELRDPEGTVLADTFCSGSYGYSATTCSTTFEDTLLLSGTYTVAVSDQGSDETGNYVLQVERFPPPNPSNLLYGSAVIDTITPQADMDVLVFEATAGTIVRIVVSGRSNAFDPRLELRDPEGTVLADTFCSGSYGYSATTCSITFEDTLLLSGTYTVAVSDQGSDENGSYQLELQCLFGDCPAE